MGEIVFWTLIRITITIPFVWILRGYLDYSVWWVVVVFAIYGFVIHPVILSYRKFEEKNKNMFESSLCSSCKHVDKSAVLCIKYDKHPTLEYLPCEGKDWEPINFENNN